MRDLPNWVFFLVRLTFGVSVSALMTWAGYKLGGGHRAWTLIAFLSSTPILAGAIAKPFVEMIHDGFGWLLHHPLQAWHGNYYEFNRVHVRVLEDGDRLWFCANDIVVACHLDGLTEEIPGVRIVKKLPSLTIEGVDRFHHGHANAELARFLIWAKREVVTPWERKRTGSLVPPQY